VGGGGTSRAPCRMAGFKGRQNGRPNKYFNYRKHFLISTNFKLMSQLEFQSEILVLAISTRGGHYD
jgi:hypothetical protein